jgi:hypothetical protein
LIDPDLTNKYKNFQKKRRLTFLDYDKKQHFELVKKQSISIKVEENYSELLKYSAILTSDPLAILEFNLILLDPHEKSLYFSDLLNEIFSAYPAFDSDQETAEDEFRNSI